MTKSNITPVPYAPTWLGMTEKEWEEMTDKQHSQSLLQLAVEYERDPMFARKLLFGLLDNEDAEHFSYLLNIPNEKKNVKRKSSKKDDK